jgi:hypothetical protein
MSACKAVKDAKKIFPVWSFLRERARARILATAGYAAGNLLCFWIT